MKDWAPLVNITSWNSKAHFCGFTMPWDMIIVSVWGLRSVLKSLGSSLIGFAGIISQWEQSFMSFHQLFCEFINLYAAKIVIDPPVMSIFPVIFSLVVK